MCYRDVEVLQAGGLLHTYAGGNWLADNDLDSRMVSPRNGQGVCVCPYSGACALCAVPPPGSKPEDDPGLEERYGATWWLPLPRCTNLGVRTKVANVTDAYTTWYGTYWDTSTNGYGEVLGHWSKWREQCIRALEHYDSDGDGRIRADEVFRKMAGSLDHSWVRRVDRCVLYDAIVYADGALQYLREISRLEAAGVDMMLEAPAVHAILPTGGSEAFCKAKLAPALEEFLGGAQSQAQAQQSKPATESVIAAAVQSITSEIARLETKIDNAIALTRPKPEFMWQSISSYLGTPA